MIKRKLPPPNPTLGDAVREFLEDRRAKGTADTTCETYDRKLRLLFIDVLDQRLNEMDYPEVRSRLVRIAEATSNGNSNTYLRAARAFFNWANIDQDYEVAFDPSKLTLMKTKARLPYALNVEQMACLLAQPNKSTFAGLRDFTMLVVLLSTGIRSCELLGLTVQDVETQPQSSRLQQPSIRVLGKGNKERKIVLTDEVAAALRQWLARRADALDESGVSCSMLFPTASGTKLTYRQLLDRVKLHGDNAGIKGPRLSPHKLRSTFATSLAREGARLQSIQFVLGQTTLTMAKQYTRVEDPDAVEETLKFNPLRNIDLRRHSRR